MNMREAKERLSALVGGMYHQVEISLSETKTGHLTQDCRVWCLPEDGSHISGSSNTWAGAFEIFEAKLNGSDSSITADLEAITDE